MSQRGFAQTVPAQDSANNNIAAEVVGNKTDTVAGDSLVALARIIIANLGTVDGLHDVPATDSAANLLIRDVVGSKLDRTYNGGNSIWAYAHTLDEHAHGTGLVLPDLAASIVVTCGAAGFAAYGAESASLGTPGDDFDIHWIDIVANANDQYQIRISVAGTPVWYGAFERVGVQQRSFALPVMMPITAPGAITVAGACNAGGSTLNVKVMYHTY